MQNEHQPSGFRRFLRDNGYYLVIGLCALAIGISGYFLLRGDRAAEAPEEPASLSVPAVLKPDTKQKASGSVTKKTPAAVKPDSAVFAPAQEPAETPAPAAAPRVVVAPVPGETLAGYSVLSLRYNETTRDWRTHDAIDLAAEVGSTVRAAEDGTVSALYADDSLGTVVEISHASGCTTVYANLAAEPPVTVGQRVLAGDPIGTVGASALLEAGDAPHLHFAVRQDGASTDPAAYLAG